MPNNDPLKNKCGSKAPPPADVPIGPIFPSEDFPKNIVETGRAFKASGWTSPVRPLNRTFTLSTPDPYFPEFNTHVAFLVNAERISFYYTFAWVIGGNPNGFVHFNGLRVYATYPQFSDWPANPPVKGALIDTFPELRRNASYPAYLDWPGPRSIIIESFGYMEYDWPPAYQKSARVHVYVST